MVDFIEGAVRRMKCLGSVVAAGAVALLLHNVQAATPAAVSFGHNDWELACDNTRTCRAAGYQADEEKRAISVLLTRKAGPHEAVVGKVMLGQLNDDFEQPHTPLQLTLRINGQSLGRVVVDPDSLIADLSAQQVHALVVALARTSTIEWVAGKKVWRLSDQGASAVLLKMDEFQGRLGTPGALIKKGARREESVLPALAAPVVTAAPVMNRQADEPPQAVPQALQEAIRTQASATCDNLLDNEADAAEWQVERLTPNKLLVSTLCWSAAYNLGYGYWVTNEAAPHQPVLVTTSGVEYGNGVISGGQKGRGLGDCWSKDTWTWNGEAFVHTESLTTGMCKLVAPGGAWELPTLVTTVVKGPSLR